MERDDKPAFRSTRRSAEWAKGLMIATLVLAVVSVISGLLQIALVSRAVSVSEAEAAANASLQQLIRILHIVIQVATAITFLVWFHSAHKNLDELNNPSLRYTTEWAVFGFVVPFLNLVRPYQVMRETWLGSKPDMLRQVGIVEPGSPSTAPKRLGIVRWWWALFLITSIVGNLAVLPALLVKTLDELMSHSVILVVRDFFEIAGSILAIRLITAITSNQLQRSAKIRETVTKEVLPPERPSLEEEKLSELSPSSSHRDSEFKICPKCFQLLRLETRKCPRCHYLV